MAWVILIAVIFSLIISYKEYLEERKKNPNYIKTKEQREVNKRNKIQKREKAKLSKVYSLGNLGKSLDKINKKYLFLKVEHREIINCSTINEYFNFNKKSYFASRFSEISDLVSNLYENVKKNYDIYLKYQNEFFACNNFTSNEEIKNIKNRGMSIKKFKLLEQNLHNEIKKEIPKNDILLIIVLNYQDKEKIIEIHESEINKLLQEIKEEKEYIYVCQHSFLYEELNKLNETYKFKNLKVPKYNIKCNSYNEYQKFDLRKYVLASFTKQNRIIGTKDELELIYNQACENQSLYNEYKYSYLDLSKRLRKKSDIEGLSDVPLSVEEFQRIEKNIYNNLKIKEPVVDFSIIFKVEYTSPAGRNHYAKEEYLSKKTLCSILKEEKSIRQEEEMRRERLLAEKEEIQREKRKEKSLQRREDMLVEKEEKLIQREREFEQATKGHIYAIQEEYVSFTKPQYKFVEKEESLSAWEKMKQLKKSYENGEITYEEYSEKRKNLL